MLEYLGLGILCRLLYSRVWARMTQSLSSFWKVNDFFRSLGLPHSMVAFLHSGLGLQKVWQVILKMNGSSISAALVLLQWRFYFHSSVQSQVFCMSRGSCSVCVCVCVYIILYYNNMLFSSIID